MQDEPRIVSEKLLAEGRRVKLYSRLVEYKCELFEKDVVRFGEAVVIVPIINPNRVVMVKQWRAAVSGWVLEVPAGKVESGEQVSSAARRELEEETGFTAEVLVKIASLYATPGYSDEVMHVFAARGLSKLAPRPESSEILEVVEVSPDWYLNQLDSTTCDLKTAAALLLCKLQGWLS
ncbi:MAG: NUDIX hydrolase [Thermofilaceae archaeon]